MRHPRRPRAQDPKVKIALGAVKKKARANKRKGRKNA